jgi:hypothetical protein
LRGVYGHVRSHALQQRQKRASDERERWCQGIVRAANKLHLGGAVSTQQGQQHGLKDQRGTAGAANIEAITAWLHGPRLEQKRRRSQFGAIYLSPTDRLRSSDTTQMLPHQAWFGPLAADVLQFKRPLSQQGQGECGAQYLPSPFAGAAIQSQVFHVFIPYS